MSIVGGGISNSSGGINTSVGNRPKENLLSSGDKKSEASKFVSLVEEKAPVGDLKETDSAHKSDVLSVNSENNENFSKVPERPSFETLNAEIGDRQEYNKQLERLCHDVRLVDRLRNANLGNYDMPLVLFKV